MRQQKRPIAPKGDAFLHLFVTEKRIPRPLKTHHLVFQQAAGLAVVLSRGALSFVYSNNMYGNVNYYYF
jgi:hypothetical protein